MFFGEGNYCKHCHRVDVVVQFDCVQICIFLCMCVQLDPLPKPVLEQRPNANAVRSLEKVLEIHSELSPSLCLVARTHTSVEDANLF